jgi:hypothetical protein
LHVEVLAHELSVKIKASQLAF